MHAERDFVADLIPVDVVINAMIVAAWKTAQDYAGNSTIPPVYNVTSSSIKPITWGKYYRYVDTFYRNSYITNTLFLKVKVKITSWNQLTRIQCQLCCGKNLFLPFIYALSFYVTKTVLVGPKWFWSDQFDLDLTIMIWSRPK
jgi:hypothetical protein